MEKNVEAFLKLDLPGTKLVVGDGPARSQLTKAYPDAVFLGSREGEALAEIYAAADVFVFPSRTDTFGLVLLEALASGVPVAGFPAAAPRDVIGEAPVGRLDEDLRRACLEALELSRDDCREFALGMTWEASARIFLEHVAEAAKFARAKSRAGRRLKNEAAQQGGLVGCIFYGYFGTTPSTAKIRNFAYWLPIFRASRIGRRLVSGHRLFQAFELTDDHALGWRRAFDRFVLAAAHQEFCSGCIQSLAPPSARIPSCSPPHC